MDVSVEDGFCQRFASHHGKSCKTEDTSIAQQIHRNSNGRTLMPKLMRWRPPMIGDLSIAHCVAGALEIELCLLLAVKMLPSPSLSYSSSSCWYCSLFSHGKGTASR